MSFYASMKGSLTFNNREQFRNALVALNCWLDNDTFMSERWRPYAGGPHIDRENMIIHIPYGYYRNMSRTVDAVSSNVKGKIVATSTDGVFLGWTIIDGHTTEFDLEKWWIEQGEDGKIPDIDVDLEGYCCIWQNEVQNAFFEANS